MNPSSATIVAIASAPGPGQRGVVRVSGPRAAELVQAVFRADTSTLDLARRAVHAGRFSDGVGTQPALLLWMPGPRSFTREDVAEFHLPGTPALLDAALCALLGHGAELAAPGEFTRRAFLSGRIDLTRAEGVLALVQASNEAAARAAHGLVFGGLAVRVEHARDALVDLRALCEASLDFEENDTGQVPNADLAQRAAHVARELEIALSAEVRRAGWQGEPRIALVGAPNAGKSSLFNVLAGRDLALVSEVSGTTRDTLAVEIDLDGRRALLLDTAGIDGFEDEGNVPSWNLPVTSGLASGSAPADQARARAHVALRSAELVVCVMDASAATRATFHAARARLPASAAGLVAWNKTDLVAAPSMPPESWFDAATRPRPRVVGVSARTGTGRAELVRAFVEALDTAVSDAVEVGEGARLGTGLERELWLRHRTGLVQARAELGLAQDLLARGWSVELVAEHLRSATRALDEIHGSTTPEDVLDRIFARFCLGK